MRKKIFRHKILDNIRMKLKSRFMDDSSLMISVGVWAGEDCKNGRDAWEDTCLKCGMCGRKFDRVGRLRK